MVSPLDVIVAYGGEDVEYLGSTRSAVEDIADDMQGVDSERMDEIADGDEELFGATGLDDGINDGIVIGVAVVLLEVGLV